MTNTHPTDVRTRLDLYAAIRATVAACASDAPLCASAADVADTALDLIAAAPPATYCAIAALDQAHLLSLASTRAYAVAVAQRVAT